MIYIGSFLNKIVSSYEGTHPKVNTEYIVKLYISFLVIMLSSDPFAFGIISRNFDFFICAL